MGSLVSISRPAIPTSLRASRNYLPMSVRRDDHWVSVTIQWSVLRRILIFSLEDLPKIHRSAGGIG
jgi:hypothetical protein